MASWFEFASRAEAIFHSVFFAPHHNNTDKAAPRFPGSQCSGIRKQKRYLTITVPFGFCGNPDDAAREEAADAVVYEVRVRGVRKWRDTAMRGEWSDYVRTSYTCQLAKEGERI